MCIKLIDCEEDPAEPDRNCVDTHLILHKLCCSVQQSD
jgi:hypothetical protein